MTKLRFPGLDVHAETIAEPGGEVRSIGRIPNRHESIRKMIGKLGPVKAFGHATKPVRPVTCCTGNSLSLVWDARLWRPP